MNGIDMWRYIVAGVSFLACVGVAIANKESPGTPPVAGFILEPHHLILAVLIALIILSLGGKNLAEFIRGLTKKSSDVTVNLEGIKESSRPIQDTRTLLVNPDLCKACQAEHERSLANKANIERLFEKVDRLKECFDIGFKQISKEIGDTKTEIIKALAAR